MPNNRIEPMRALHPCIALALLTFSVQAAQKDLELEVFEANRAKWLERRISDYEFRLRDETCWCLYGPYYGPIRVVVRDGEITRAVYEGERRDGYWRGRTVRIETNLKATVEDVFERAKRVIASASEGTYRIEYDKEFGFPVRIDFDDPSWEDEQWRLVVDGFKPRS